jgi:hypothetical protein
VFKRGILLEKFSTPKNRTRFLNSQNDVAYFNALVEVVNSKFVVDWVQG